MSTGIFLGIKASYGEQAQSTAEDFISKINEVLKAKGIPSYQDPSSTPDPYVNGYFGASALDHHSANCLQKLGEMAVAHLKTHHLRLLQLNPYRVAYLPREIDSPFVTAHQEVFWPSETRNINVGSSHMLLKELRQLAVPLQIQLVDGAPIPDHLEKINNLEPFEDGEDPSLTEDGRTSWLLMYEGARLSIKFQAALSLAG